MLTATVRDLTAVLRIDGVRHDVGDVAVLPQAEPFPGGLRWSLQVAGPDAARLMRWAEAPAPVRPSRRPTRAVAARILSQLRALLLRARHGRPRFSLCTIDRVDAGPTWVRLYGTCSPILPAAFEPPRPLV